MRLSPKYQLVIILGKNSKHTFISSINGRAFNTILRTNPTSDVTHEKALGENLLAVIGKPKFEKLVYFKAEVPMVILSGYVTRTMVSGSMYSGTKLSKE